jgi:hypothetical protein
MRKVRRVTHESLSNTHENSIGRICDSKKLLLVGFQECLHRDAVGGCSFLGTFGRLQTVGTPTVA